MKRQAIPDEAQRPSKPTLRFPASAGALTSFAHNLQKTSTNITRLALQSSVDIQILDVVPIGLDSVVVNIDEEVLAKLEAANQRYRKGQLVNGSTTRHSGPWAQSKQRSTTASNGAIPEDRWEGAIRTAMKAHRIIHTGDLLPLPLSSHPITHTPPPPAVVELCEPVSQGVITPETKVIVVPIYTHNKHSQKPNLPSPAFPLTNSSLPEEDEDTSNEQFYSAAEDASRSPAATGKVPLSEPSHSDDDDTQTSTEDDTDLSDAEGDILGLSLPSLPAQPSGTFSTFTSATPRVSNPFMDGIASPGSAVSGYSMSTVLGGTSNGKLFEVHGLLSQVPTEMLHPKPPVDEDEEARVFVDTALLAKIGCFSGDWVRVEAAAEEGLSTLGSWGFGGDGEETPEWRVMRLYALPGQSSKRPRYAINKTAQNRHSRPFMVVDKAPPRIHMSPLILFSLGGPSNVRVAKIDLSPGRRSSRLGPPPPAPVPPVAKEMTLKSFATPVTYERSLDSNLKWAIENYFKRRRRLVKSGDLIGIPINESLGRAVFQGAGDEDPVQKELFAGAGASSPQKHESAENSVAWFKVAAVRADIDDAESPWGPLALVNSDITRVAKDVDFRGKLPEATHSSWQYYLGTKQLPLAPDDPQLDPEQPVHRPQTYISHLRRRLRELISAATSPQAIHRSMPPIAILLVSTQRHIGKSAVALDACADLGLHAFSVDCHDIVSERGAGGGDVETAGHFKARLERGLLSGPEYTSLLVKHIDVLNSDRTVASLKEILAQSRILIATTTKVDKLSESMRSLFTHELELSAPDEGEREGILRSIVQDLSLPVSADIDLSAIAVKTAALVAGDLVDVVKRAAIARQERLEKLAADSTNRGDETSLPATVQDITIAGGNASRRIIKADFDVAVEAARKNFADAIGAPKIPNVGWNDVGGLSNVKDAVMETIQLPLERPELFAKGMKKRSGILFYGPPGTGKTLLAKAIATEFSLNFFSIKGPELLNMYIGESEANVRRVFRRARDARPCVVFFDELDSVAPKRGNQGDSGGVMDRIVSQLLAELDGMSGGDDGNGSGVFVIGATNRPDLLDQALLRPGRFDKMLYLGVSDTNEKQLTILEALTRKYVPQSIWYISRLCRADQDYRFTLHPMCRLSSVAASLPFTFTGADLYALCSDAMLKAITRRADAVDAKVHAINTKRAQSNQSSRSSSQSGHHSADNTDQSDRKKTTAPTTVAQFFDHYATDEDTEVVVEEGDFHAARRELVPSVSTKELEHYDRVRRTFETVAEDKAQKQKRIRKGRVTGHPPGHFASDGPNGEHENDSDDFVVRADKMSLEDWNGVDLVDKPKVNGFAALKKRPSANGAVDKGKGKGRALQSPMPDESTGFDFGFGNVTDGDEDALYS